MTQRRRCGIVSGGSRGLGRAVVERLLADGHAVATFSRNSSDFTDRLRRELPEDVFLWEALDAADSDAVGSFVRRVCRAFGGVDVLVNNAGVLLEGLLTTTPLREVERMMRINLVSAIALAQACAKAMMRSGAGNIVNVSSVVSIRGVSGVAAYSASKAALDGLTRSLARELGRKGIRVNSVQPGYLDTELTASMTEQKLEQVVRRTPLGRLGTPADVAGLISFLLSDEARFITGQTITVDGGLTC
ncbi:MAG: 3-oxoacyl-ACP reductase [Betaproteobacteria bacterium]|nr:3-oxoacyl-ACP reductase [Betaproteobacteria bacterium]